MTGFSEIHDYIWSFTFTNEPVRPCIPHDCTPDNLEDRRRELLKAIFGKARYYG